MSTFETLGKGSFGVVYKVTSPEGSVFIRKIIPIKQGKSTKELVRREVDNLIKLTDNKCEKFFLCIKDYFIPEEPILQDAYIDTEYVPDSIDLFDYLNTTAIPDFDRLKSIVYLFYITQKLHGVGLVHRDLKPENILVSTKEPFPTFRLIDYGLSCDLVDAECLKDFGGTIEYISPDIVRSAIQEKKEGRNGKIKITLDQALKGDTWTCGMIMLDILIGAQWQPMLFGKGYTSSIDQRKFLEITSTQESMDKFIEACMELAGPNGNFYVPILKGILLVNPEERLYAGQAYEGLYQEYLKLEKEYEKIESTPVVVPRSHDQRSEEKNTPVVEQQTIPEEFVIPPPTSLLQPERPLSPRVDSVLRDDGRRRTARSRRGSETSVDVDNPRDKNLYSA